MGRNFKSVWDGSFSPDPSRGQALLNTCYALLTAPPETAGNAPAWVYFLNGLAVLLYLHLDCLDGKQARRTHSSSPLGQLFDHGARRW